VLALVGAMRSAPKSVSGTLQQDLEASLAALRKLADSAPHTYAHKHVLAAAELAGVEGRDLEAMRLYEQAVRVALEKGFIQEAALSAELAADFFASRGLDNIAQSYGSEARDYYRRWGAMAKVAQLDRRHPEIAPRVSQPPLPTVETSLEHLDLATVIRMSQAVAGELLLNRLIKTLMTIAIEHAGADRGLLVLPHGDNLRKLRQRAWLRQSASGLSAKAIRPLTCQRPSSRTSAGPKSMSSSTMGGRRRRFRLKGTCVSTVRARFYAFPW